MGCSTWIAWLELAGVCVWPVVPGCCWRWLEVAGVWAPYIALDGCVECVVSCFGDRSLTRSDAVVG
jgi:hypothetical protein